MNSMDQLYHSHCGAGREVFAGNRAADEFSKEESSLSIALNKVAEFVEEFFESLGKKFLAYFHSEPERVKNVSSKTNSSSIAYARDYATQKNQLVEKQEQLTENGYKEKLKGTNVYVKVAEGLDRIDCRYAQKNGSSENGPMGYAVYYAKDERFFFDIKVDVTNEYKNKLFLHTFDVEKNEVIHKAYYNCGGQRSCVKNHVTFGEFPTGASSLLVKRQRLENDEWVDMKAEKADEKAVTNI